MPLTPPTDLSAYLSGGQLPDPKANQGPKLLFIVWFLIGTSSLVLAARFWSKWERTRRLYYDDWLMLVAVILGLVHAALVTLAIHHGLGRHFIYLTGRPLYYGLLTMAFGVLAPMFARLALCITMLYLASTDPRIMKWPMWTFIAGQLILNITSVLFFYSQCGSHLSAMTDEDYAMVHKYCLDAHYQTYFNYAVGAFNCATDAFLTILPAILIQRTRLSVKKKAGLALLLCLSVIALAAAVVKTYEARALSRISDYTWDLCPYIIWVSIELNVVIIISSIPLLRPLFRRRRPLSPIRSQSMAWDTLTINSVFSKRGMRTHSQPLSVSSEDHFFPPSASGEFDLRALPAIQVTTEVSVTYQVNDAPWVHAALVGLVQGEIANPKLVR